MRLGIVALIALGIVAGARPGAAQSFTFCPSDGPYGNFRIVYYDADFLFATRGYGSATDPGGNTRPGFFVHSKAQNRYIEIPSVSTKDGRFGKSYSDVPAEMARFRGVAVGWNFTHLAAQPYAELPLHTSASIVLPDSIEYEAATGRYMLGFMSSWQDIPVAHTILYIQRQDLLDAFAKPAYPRPWNCPPL